MVPSSTPTPAAEIERLRAEIRSLRISLKDADSAMIHFMERSVAVTDEPDSMESDGGKKLEVVGYASPGQIEVLRELPRTGGMKVKGRKDDRYTEPLVLLSKARAAMLSLAARCQQEGAFKVCLECGYQDGHDDICQFHSSNRKEQRLSAELDAARGLLRDIYMTCNLREMPSEYAIRDMGIERQEQTKGNSHDA